MASKYRTGDVIQTLGELDKQESVMFNGKTINRAGWQNWQFRFIKTQLENGRLRKAVKKSKYDYVKGFKGPFTSLPKDIKEIVKERLLEMSIFEQVNDLIFEVDVYHSVDIRNCYKKE